jgi:hypothetical protein
MGDTVDKKPKKTRIPLRPGEYVRFSYERVLHALIFLTAHWKPVPAARIVSQYTAMQPIANAPPGMNARR